MVLEDGGVPVHLGLSVSDPFRTQGCKYDEECMVRLEDDCSRMNVYYEVTCNACSATVEEEIIQPDPNMRVEVRGGMRRVRKYVGTSGRSLHARQAEHS